MALNEGPEASPIHLPQATGIFTFWRFSFRQALRLSSTRPILKNREKNVPLICFEMTTKTKHVYFQEHSIKGEFLVL
jgi:hypothetical protein